MKRSQILNAVYVERTKQNSRWGKSHDRAHYMYDWFTLIQRYLVYFRNIDNPNYRRAKLISIIALCFAALEVEEYWN